MKGPERTQAPKGRSEIIAIASGKGGTGKTLIGACLGYALTFSGHRVLLVDTDTATHGLSLFLLGPKGPTHIEQFPEEHTWTGALKSAREGSSARSLPVPRVIRRDLAGESDHGVKYEVVVSARGVYGDEHWIEPAFYSRRSDFREVFREFLDHLRSQGEYDYVLIDTRGGFSFESTDACALADSFLVVTEADLTSFYQDRNLIRLVNIAAGELGTKPLLRSILVNRATEGDEKLFRVALEREFPVKFDQTHAIPLDVEALKAYKVQQMPYVTCPDSHFSYATLEAFRDVLSVVTAEWSDDRVTRWNQLVERVSKGIEEKNRKFEQERAEEERLRKKISTGPLKRWLAWSVVAGLTLALVVLSYQYFQARQQYHEMRQQQAITRLRFEDQRQSRIDELRFLVSGQDFPEGLRVRSLRTMLELGERLFNGVNLSGVNLAGLRAPVVSFANANLKKTDLRGAFLSSTDLRFTDLSGANLGGATLRFANFEGAVLRGADLRDADLEEANLWGADLAGALLKGATVTKEQLAEADPRLAYGKRSKAPPAQ